MVGARLKFLASIALMTTLLTGCDPAGFECPALAKYSREFQIQALAEFNALKPGSALRVMITDYSKHRDACRALQ